MLIIVLAVKFISDLMWGMSITTRILVACNIYSKTSSWIVASLLLDNYVA